MTLSSQTIQFKAPLKNISIGHYGPPSVSQTDVDHQLEQARQAGYQEAEAFYKGQILELQQKVSTEQTSCLQQVESQFDTLVGEINNSLPSLVISIARRVLAGTEITNEIIQAVIKDLIAEFSNEKESLEILLCPQDIELLKAASAPAKEESIPEEKNGDDFANAMAGIFASMGDEDKLGTEYPNVNFVEDETLNPGDCKVQSRFGILDGRVSTKLKRIEQELLHR